LSIALLAGRHFTAQDTADSPSVVIVDESFARRHFPQLPLGKVTGRRLRFGGQGEPWREIIGVVRHVRHYGLEEEGRAGIYRPWTQINPQWLANRTRAMDVVVKTAGEPTGLLAAIRSEVQAVDKDQPLANVRTLDALLDRSLAPRRFTLLLVAAFASVALLLGAAGIYGVMSYSVSQRTQEIGIRLALGASTGEVLRLILGQGMRLSLLGIVTGLAASLAVTRLMKSLLYEVSATDPLTFAVIALLLTGVALLACYVPARRATKVDPMVALRCE
jgi:predicted permease